MRETPWPGLRQHMERLWVGDCEASDIGGVVVESLGSGNVRMAFWSPLAFATASPGPNVAERYAAWLMNLKRLAEIFESWENEGVRFSVSFSERPDGRGIQAPTETHAWPNTSDVVEAPIEFIGSENGPAARGLVVMCVDRDGEGLDAASLPAVSLLAFIACRLDVAGRPVVARAFVPLRVGAYERAHEIASRFAGVAKPEHEVVFGLPICEDCGEYQVPSLAGDTASDRPSHPH